MSLEFINTYPANIKEVMLSEGSVGVPQMVFPIGSLLTPGEQTGARADTLEYKWGK